MAHAPGGAVPPQEAIPLGVFIRHANPELCPVLHFYLPVVLPPNGDELSQHRHAPESGRGGEGGKEGGG